MLIKLKFVPVDGSAPPASYPLVGLKDDQPLSQQIALICSKLGLADFSAYALFRLPAGVDGPVGEKLDLANTLAQYGLKNGNFLLVASPDTGSSGATAPVPSSPTPTPTAPATAAPAAAAAAAETAARDSPTTRQTSPSVAAPSAAASSPAAPVAARSTAPAAPAATPATAASVAATSAASAASTSSSPSLQPRSALSAGAGRTPDDGAVSDSGSAGTTPHSSFVSENTSNPVTGSTSTYPEASVLLRRGELEDTIEEQLFTAEGGGEIRPLYAAKVNLASVPGGKQRRERILCVVRDWCGTYALFILSASGLLGKQYGFAVLFAGGGGWRNHIAAQYAITEALPLLDTFRVEESSSATASLIVDDAVLDIEAPFTVRQQLGAALQLAYSSMYEGRSKPDTMGVRYAGVEFASQYWTAPPTTADVDKALITCFATGKTEAFVALRKLVGTPRTRDHCVQKVISYVQAKELTESRVSNALRALRQCVLAPAVTEAAFMPTLSQLLVSIHEDPRTTPDLSAAAVVLLDDFRASIEAGTTWRGRQALPDLPFPEVFFTAKQTAAARRTRQKKESAARGSAFRAGVYISAVVYTHNRNILLDAGGNLPSAFVCEARAAPQELMQGEADAPDMLWALGWLGDYPQQPLSGEEAKAVPFRAAYIDAVLALRAALGVRDLGRLYDRPIVLSTSGTVLLVHVFEADDGRPFRGTEPLSWTALAQVEHKLYQRYCDLPVQARLEQLSASYTGARFLQAIIDFNRHRRAPLAPGVYLGLLHTMTDLRGTHVMITDGPSRHMIPNVRVADKIQDKDWAWVQSLPLRAERNLPLIDLDTPDADDPAAFQQRFVKAMEQLQAEVGVEDLGRLYDIELVGLDENNSATLIVFALASKSLELPPALRARYMWRRLELFEIDHYSVFTPRRYAQFLRSVRPLEAEAAALARLPGATLEETTARRQRHKAVMGQLHRRSMLWTPMQWAPRIAYWVGRNVPAFTARVPDRDRKTVAQVVADARLLRRVPHVYARALIVAAVDRESWDDVARRLEELMARNPDEEDVLESDVVLPQMRPATDVLALDSSLDEFAAPFTLAELLPTGQTWEPAAADIGRLLAAEIVEEALVEAVDGAELTAVAGCVRDMVDVLECVDDLIEDVVLAAEKEAADARIREEQRKFAARLEEVFDVNSIPYVAAEARQRMLDKDSVEIDTPYDGRIRSAIAGFNSTVTAVEQLLSIMATLTDLASAVENVTELSLTASRKLERTAKKAQPVAVRPKVDAPMVRVNLDEVVRTQPVLDLPSPTKTGLPSAAAAAAAATTTTSPRGPGSPRSPRRKGAASSPLAAAAGQAGTDAHGALGAGSGRSPRPPLRTVVPPSALAALAAVAGAPGSPRSAASGTRSPRVMSARAAAGTATGPAGAAGSAGRQRLVLKGPTPHTSRDTRPKNSPTLLETVAQQMLTKAYFRERAKADIELAKAKRAAQKVTSPSPVSRVLAAVPDEQRQPLQESVKSVLPVGAPCRQSVRLLRQLNTLYRYAPQDTDDQPPAAGGPSRQPAAGGAERVADPRAVMPNLEPDIVTPNADRAFADELDGPTETEQLSAMAAEIFGSADHAIFLSADNTVHRISAVAAQQCAAACDASNVDHYDEDGRVPVFVWRDIAGDTLAAVIQFLEGPESIGSAASFLRDREYVLLSAANILRASLLFIYCAGHIFETLTDRQRLTEALTGSFLMQRPVIDWLRLEDELGANIPVLDYMWYLRAVAEFELAEPFESRNAGSWRGGYAELRIESFLCAGLENIEQSEVRLWRGALGLHVRSLNLSHSDARDEEVQLAASCCPGLRNINLARTAVSDVAAQALAALSELENLDLSGTPVTDHAAQWLVRMPALRRVDVRDTAMSGNGVEVLVTAKPALEIEC